MCKPRSFSILLLCILLLAGVGLAQGQTQTTTTLAVSASTPSVPSVVTLTAGVFPVATGLVHFKDGNTLLATAVLSNGNAIYKTIGLAAGSHTLTAEFVGTSNALGSSSAPSTLALNPAATTTSLQVTGDNPVNLGAAAQLTATVSTNGGGVLNGNVNLIENGNSVTSASLGTPLNTFATSQTIPVSGVGTNPFIIAMADVNGDGISFLAIQYALPKSNKPSGRVA
jgi:Bacterial Ig-like domain (group 3)